jgi:hypothetical protein
MTGNRNGSFVQQVSRSFVCVHLQISSSPEELDKLLHDSSSVDVPETAIIQHQLNKTDELQESNHIESVDSHNPDTQVQLEQCQNNEPDNEGADSCASSADLLLPADSSITLLNHSESAGKQPLFSSEISQDLHSIHIPLSEASSVAELSKETVSAKSFDERHDLITDGEDESVCNSNGNEQLVIESVCSGLNRSGTLVSIAEEVASEHDQATADTRSESEPVPLSPYDEDKSSGTDSASHLGELCM